MPKKTPTFVETTSYETSYTPFSPLIIRIKKTVSGAKRIIYKIELTATKIV